MLPAVVLAVLVAAAVHAAWNALLKGRPGSDPAVMSAALSLSGVLLGIPLVLVLPAPSPASLPYLLASVGVHVVYFGALTHSYTVGAFALVYPIARGLPPALIALVGAVLLGERLLLHATVGVALVSAGVVAMGLSRDGHGPDGRAVTWGIVTALLIALYSVLDGLGARLSGSAPSYVALLMTLHGVCYTALSTLRGGKPFAARVVRSLPLGMISGACSAGAYAVVLWAMTTAPLALVSALRETSILFGIAYSALFLGEPIDRRRALSAVAIAMGAMLVALNRA